MESSHFWKVNSRSAGQELLIIIIIIIIFMESSHFWKVNSRSAGQELLINIIIISMDHSLKKPPDPQLVKKFPALLGKWMSITAFTRSRHLSVVWARSIDSMPPNNFLKIIFSIILPSISGFPSGFFPSNLLTKTLYTPLISSIHSTFPTNHSLLDIITRMIFGEEYITQCSSVCSLIQSSVTSSHIPSSPTHSRTLSA